MQRVAILACVIGLMACSKSTTPGDDDGGIVFDGAVLDGAPDTSPRDTGIDAVSDGGVPDTSPPVRMCGNGMVDGMEECDDGNMISGDGCSISCRIEEMGECGDSTLDAGEECDDGNTESGDGCTAMCMREAFCGDGEMTGDEVCDDGNNRSGDGCRADCASDETCGNSIVDSAAGELCDGGPGCGPECDEILMCGDGVVVDPEECDDFNTDRLDGCDAGCRIEHSLIISEIEIANRMTGCDYSGDDRPDNAFARALGPLTSIVNSMFLRNAARDGSLTLLMHMLGLDDPNMSNDDSFTIAWFQGNDFDDDPSNNVSGSGEFYADAAAFDMMGRPSTSFASAVSSNALTGGPEDVSIPIAFLPIDLNQGVITGTTTSDAMGVNGITEGQLCGAVPVSTLAFLPNPLTMAPGGAAPPCGDETAANLADVMIGGTSSGLISLPGVSPDVDIDGDGLEHFEVLRGPDCQPVVVACVDGDGTRVEGHDCTLDPRFADGFSAAFAFSAVRAIVHAAPVAMPGG